MKLSEIRGERVLDVVADVIDPIVSIAMDKDAAEIFERKPCPEGMTPTEFVLSRIKKSMPKLIKSHKPELVAIMSAINDVPADEYMEGLTLAKLMRDLTDLLTDEEFLGFFA